jgi:hypothetical protein
MNDFLKRISNLSPTKRALLRKRLAEHLDTANPVRSVSDQRLVAYLVCQTKDDTTVARIRETLQNQLPDYMVPTAFVMLDALPLMPNGKVDRQALPEPEQTTSDHEFVAPQTDAEIALAEIWTQVLGINEVSVYDNFFELGGHSLLVTQTISRMREAFEIELPLQTLFEAPTIAEQAIVVEEMLIAELQAMPDTDAEAAAWEQKIQR